MVDERHLRVERTARYHTLGPEDERVHEVWFLLHGYGQLAGEFIRYFADLDDGTRLLVAPEALNRFYLVPTDVAPAQQRPVGATWMTREDRDAEIGDYVAYLERLHGAVLQDLTIEPKRVIVVGFSQGAATASRWVARGSARIDALVLWGGLLPPDFDLSRHGAALRGVPLVEVVGTRDHYVNADAVAAEERRLTDHGVPYRMQRFDGGHAIKRVVLRELAAMLSAMLSATVRGGP